MSKVSTAIKSTSVAAKTIGQDIKGFFKDAFTTAKEKAQEVGTKAVTSVVNMEEEMNRFAQKTGRGTEETEKYRELLEKIYSNNYGESFTHIASAMAEVTQKMGDMDGFGMSGEEAMNMIAAGQGQWHKRYYRHW